MAFLSPEPPFHSQRPLFAVVLGNTLLSTVPGISGAGPSPARTVFTPILDAELVVQGRITSRPMKPNTPTGCPTPATITHAMLKLMGVEPVFINAGLTSAPTVPCIDIYGEPGRDPRNEDAVPQARTLYDRGTQVGRLLSRCSDLLVLGECVPGGTTTALCVLRAMGYDARVSSSFIRNPTGLKEEICRTVGDRISRTGTAGSIDILRLAGDPMMPVAAGIIEGYSGQILLAGGTQMLAVAAARKALDRPIPPIATTVYVRDDPSANFASCAAAIGTTSYYVDPAFGDLGHEGLARYCIGEVKEGMGAGGAMMLAYLLGNTPDQIREAIFAFIRGYS